MSATPEQLFLRFRAAGDPQALGELFDLTSPQLLSLALHLCGNPADAEDALQATFVTAIGRAATWDPGRPVQPWLGGILTLQCKKIGERRARRREAQLPEADLVLDDGSPLAANERRELVAALREHIDRLPQEQRQVLLLQLEHGLSPAEVAEVLAVAPGTVRMRLHRGLKALRGLLPAGLVAVLLAALPARGLAAVRAAVVQHGVAAAAVGGGALLLKKMFVAAAVLAVFGIGWVVAVPWSRAAEPELPGPATPVASRIERPAVGAPSEAPTPGERAEAPAAESAPSAAAPARGSLLVRVVYADSRQPVPNVPVGVLPERSDREGSFELVTAATGRDGTCTIADLAPGPVCVTALSQRGVVIRAGETTTAELQVPDEQCPLVTVRGRVVHLDGRPAPGARIVAAPQGRSQAEVIGVADAAGRFQVSIARGFLLLGARLAGFAPAPQQSFRNLEDVELVLPGPGAGVAGLVVDGNGAPVPDAFVQIGDLRRSQQWRDPRGWLLEAAPPQRLRTDREGRFAAVDLPADEIGVLVRADGFAPFHCYVRTVAAETVEARCVLAPGVALRGRVIDEAGAPVVGASVSLGGTSGDQRTTDADGRFGYRYVAPGPQRLEVSGEGIAQKYCERGEVETGEWTVVVQRLPRFLFRFVDELGSPLAGWRMELRMELRSSTPRWARTDAAGRVALYPGGEGACSLGLAPPGGIHAVMPWPWPAGLVAGIETTIVVPTAQQPAAVIAGVVLGPDGAPLPDGTIEVCGADDRALYRQRLAAGPFRFDRVPAGDWALVVRRQGRGACGGRFAVAAVQHGEVRDVGELRLPREGLLQVRVVLADGNTPRDASVYLWDGEHREHQAPPRDGQAHPWPVGRYTWRVMDNDSLWENGACEVRAGETASIEVVLRPAVLRYLQFPVPRPDWGEPKRIDYVLRAPDGSVYDASDFDPREEMPFRYMPALCLGTWRLELQLDDGRRFGGAFTLDSMAPSREPIAIAVTEAR